MVECMRTAAKLPERNKRKMEEENTNEKQTEHIYISGPITGTKDYMKRVGRSFTKSKGISYNKKEKTIAFQESITDKQQISVKLQIYYPEKKNDPCYEVIKWKKEAVGVWKKDDSLPVYRNK